MGYSAAADSFCTMDMIGKALDLLQPERVGSNSFFDSEGRENFWQIGREQIGGAIVGSIMGEQVRGSGLFYPVGSFRIEPNGDIKRFTRLPRAIRNELRTVESRRLFNFETLRREALAKLGGTLEQAWQAVQTFAGDYQRETGTMFLGLPACNLRAMYGFVKSLSIV